MLHYLARLKAAAALLVLTGQIAWGQEVCPDRSAIVPNGFLTVGDFANLPTERAGDVAMGFINGYTVAALAGASEPCIRLVNQRCFNGRTNLQLAAIMRQWAQANPRRWHEPLNTAMFHVLVNICLHPDRG